MPTSYTDQFWIIDPFNPPPTGTTLNVFSFEIIDQNDNNLINRFAGDSIDGVDITSSYPADTVTVTLSSGAQVTITGTTFYLADNRVVFTPSDGSVLETATLVETTFETGQGPLPVDNLGPPCIVAGTSIKIPTGWASVENLKPNEVVTGHTGTELRLWKVLSRHFNVRDLHANEKNRRRNLDWILCIQKFLAKK